MQKAGIDACPAGWLVVDFENSDQPYRIIEDQESLKKFIDEYDRIFIDIPIGVPVDRYTRKCDEALRKELGPDYQSSVFDPPVRPALYAPTYGEACVQSYSITDKKVSLQAWNISAKIKQVDQILTEHKEYREKVFESHPEMLFKILNGQEVVKQKKQISKGLKHRLKLLKNVEKRADSIYRAIKDNYRRKEVKEDDIVDAMVLAHFARQSEDHPIRSMPEEPGKDPEDLTMAIHYVELS